MKRTQTTLKAALLLTVLAMLSACQKQTSSDSSADFSSRTTSTSTVGTNAVVLNCNQKSQGGITAKMMVYTDSTGQVRNDYMKIKFTAMPSSFTSGDYIEFFRWQANSAGQTYLDQVPVQARFETLDGRPLTNFSDVTYWGQVSAIAKQAGMDMNTFFQNVRLVVNVRDPQAAFDVLKIAMYTAAGTNTINMDMLMPSFYANPSDYAVDQGATRASALQALHPFAGMIGQSWTSAQYQSMGSSFCF